MSIRSRRQFLQAGGATLLAVALPAALGKTLANAPKAGAAAPFPKALDPAAASLYRNAFVLDCNTLASVGLQFADAPGFQALRDSGLSALKSTLGGANGTFEETVADIAAAQKLIEQHPDLFIKVKGHADLERAKPENKVAVIFSFEAASPLEDKLDRIDLFRQFDVLVMQLTYNHKTPFGVGCLDGETGGVTELGRNAIARMNTLGVALDVSHANTQTTAEGIALSTRPPVITHSGCRAVFKHPRNKRDQEMKALADKGGVMGIYMLPFLAPDDKQPMLADYMQHMVHALKVCGEDHVGIGTDSMFFTVTDQDLQAIKEDEERRRKMGVGAPGENRPPYIPDINTPRKLEYVAGALLKHGYSARVAEKVLGLNFSRVFKEIWTA
ncbi:MAG TPA: membrane dipeptidase [Rhodanobacteraceae bacterium]|jgi:membrane dipeptidase|nr:membrane dipeptidase [Rhodanobacteraceae bacterium]